MSGKKNSGVSVAPHVAGDRDLTFNGGMGFIRGAAMTFVADPTTRSDQLIYMTNVSIPVNTAPTEIFRFHADGTADKAFGRLQVPWLDAQMLALISIQGLIFDKSKNASGESTITCVGVTQAKIGDGIYFYPAAIRITTAGVMDESFGEKGVMIYKFDKPADAHGEQPGDRHFNPFATFRGTHQVAGDILFCCGLLNRVEPTAGYAYVIVKFDENGEPVANYGSNGVLEITSVSDPEQTQWGDYGVDGTGSVTLAGGTRGQTAGILSRYDSAGKLDLNYGVNGRKIIEIEGYSCYITQLHVSDAGSATLCVFLRELQEGNNVIAVIRLMKNGEPDAMFNGGNPLFVNEIKAGLVILTVDSENRVVIGGDNPVVKARSRVIRILPSGLLDTGFSDDGVADYLTLTQPARMSIHNGADILAVCQDLELPTPLTPEMVRFFGEST